MKKFFENRRKMAFIRLHTAPMLFWGELSQGHHLRAAITRVWLYKRSRALNKRSASLREMAARMDQKAEAIAKAW